MLTKRKNFSCDVLVIGGGAAGIRSAMAAADDGARVILVLKGFLGLDGSSFCRHNEEHIGYQAGIGVGGDYDTPDAHARDTLQAGLGMCSPALVEVLALESPARLGDLVNMGVRLKRDGAEFLRVPACFSEARRAFVISHVRSFPRRFEADFSGAVGILQGLSVTKLLVRDNTCFGAVGFNHVGEFVEIRSRATVLATGGGAGLFARTMAPRGQTGDGYVLGFEAGAQLINLEFIQIMLGLARLRRTQSSRSVQPSSPPKGLRRSFVPLAKADGNPFFPIDVLGDGVRIYNSRGEDVLEENLPPGVSAASVFRDRKRHSPFSVRDASGWLDIAVMREILAGRHGEGGGVFVNVRANGKIFEVVPYAQAFNGGLLVDGRGETRVEGLFACGETAGGMHGADRLGGNMMSATQVFGERAGRFAARRARRASRDVECRGEAMKEWLRLRGFVGRDGLGLVETDRRLRRLAWENLLTVRSEARLGLFLGEVERLEEDVREARVETSYRLRLLTALEKMLALARLVAVAARERRESRGSHFREDYPFRDDLSYGKPHVLSREGISRIVFSESTS